MMVHNNECMDYSADGKHLVTAGFDGLVKIVGCGNRKLERILTGHSWNVSGVHSHRISGVLSAMLGIGPCGFGTRHG